MVHRVVAAAAVVVLVGGVATGGAWVRADRAEDARAAAEERVSGAVTVSADDASAEVLHDLTGVRAGTLGAHDSASAAFAAALAAGDQVLGATASAVTDEAARQALADELAAVRAAPPASALASRESVARIAAATAAVSASHDAWTAQQQAAAAAAAAAATAAAAKPRASAPKATPPSSGASAKSCETTYTGPPFYTSPPTEGGDGSNGRLPPSALTAVSWDVDPRGTPYYLKTAAAAALERLDGAFVAAFGHHLDLDLTYRDYDTQVAMRAALGSVAAVPGTSSHGTGLALDVPELPCEYGYGTPQRNWLASHGPSYGWVVPSWAKEGGSNPEYWHFEFIG